MRQYLARLRYAFDRSMAAGTAALIGWLFLLSMLMIAFAAVIVAIAGITPADDDDMDFIEAFWASLMRTLDPGTMGDDQGWPFRLLMLAVTLTGIFIVSALIGIISTGLASKLEQLRKGRSLVIEDDHTIIFNWTDSIFDIVSQLVIANESRWRPCIVIMADRDKAEMEDEIAAKVGKRHNSRIICRSGDPTDLYDIGIVNPQTCRSVIILSPETADPDACVIKTILTLTTDPKRREAPYRIAAEIRDSRNAEVARLVGGSEAQIVLFDELISRIIVQSTRQPGLSDVYTDLLNFEGCEIYVVEQPELEGKSFGDAQLEYERCTLMGICEADRIRLGPPAGTIINPGSKAVLLAEDDERIEWTSAPGSESVLSGVAEKRSAQEAERTLLLGWNRRVPMIARELSRHVQPGSHLTIAADTAGIEAKVAGLKLPTGNLEVELKRTDTSRRADIEALDPLSYDHVLLLAYSDDMEPQAADTRTLITLLHLRNVRECGAGRVDVVSEIIDVRNVPLAKLTRVDDFVVSNKLVSLMLAQASEDEHFEEIFRDLLDEEGVRIELEPASSYVPLGQELDFRDVVRAASRCGDTAIGHSRPRPKDAAPGKARAVELNPVKSKRVSYAEGDRIIVLTRGIHGRG